MNLATRCLLAIPPGLAAGWMFFAPSPGQTPEGPPASSRPVAEVPRSRPERTRAISDLPDVQSCRDRFAAASRDDGRHPLLRQVEAQEALRRWIELDPAGALAEAEKAPSSAFAKGLILAWVEVDPAGAIDAVHRSGRSLAGAVAKDFFLALMAKDPKLAVAEFRQPRWQQEGEAFLGWGFHQEIYRQWMLSDPESAIAELGTLKDKSWNASDPQAVLVSAWAEVDFAAAWKYLQASHQENGENLTTESFALEMLAHGLAANSPDALKSLESLLAASKAEAAADSEKGSGFGRDFDSHAYLLQLLANRFAEANPALALEFARKQTGNEALRQELFFSVAGEIASADPVQALELLKEAGTGEDSRYDLGVVREAFASLAAQDPAAAREKLAGMPADQQAGAVSGYLTNLFALDPGAAAAQCREWLADPQLAKAAKEGWAIAFSWGHGAGIRDPGPVLAAVPALNDAVDENVLSTWAKGDPEAAAGWISGRLQEGKKVQFGSEGIFAEFAISSPEFTSNWVKDLPDPKLQAEAADTLTANWAAFDPAAARRWVDSLEPGPLRDAAEHGMTRTNDSR